MRPISRWLWIVAIAATTWSTPARAADKLESIIKKPDLTNEDRARVDQEVQDRAQRLSREADGTPDDREKARMRFLDTLAISGATGPALDYYAERSAFHLGPLVLGDSRPVAEDAAMVLRTIDHPSTGQSLISGLRSPYESVQYHCASGIRDLRSKIGDNQSLMSSALDMLGDVGANTKNEALLRVVYEAMDFAGVIPNFAGGDLQANALASVFAARLKHIDLGSQDELKDAAGYRTAAGIATAKAGVDAKRQVLAALVSMLDAHARRYGDRDTRKEYLPTLRRLVDDLEKAIHAIMQSEGTNPPGRTLGSVVKDRPSADQARAASDAVSDLRDILKREPWKIG